MSLVDDFNSTFDIAVSVSIVKIHETCSTNYKNTEKTNYIKNNDAIVIKKTSTVKNKQSQ